MNRTAMRTLIQHGELSWSASKILQIMVVSTMIVYTVLWSTELPLQYLRQQR